MFSFAGPVRVPTPASTPIAPILTLVLLLKAVLVGVVFFYLGPPRVTSPSAGRGASPISFFAGPILAVAVVALFTVSAAATCRRLCRY